MCDYSLMMLPNRLATEGEELVAHRFQNGTTGLVAGYDFKLWQAERKSKGFWQRLVSCFPSVTCPTPVVCVPPGARVLLESLSGFPRDRFGLGESEIATFTQLSAEVNENRDALCFDNGPIVRLGMLAEGQRVRILTLSRPEETEPSRKRRKHVSV